MVFKTIVDPFVGKISYIKVMSGVLTSDSQIYNVNKAQAEKINQIYIIKGKNQIAVGKLFTGDIGAVVKLQYTQTNDTLATKEKAVHYAPINFPVPMLGYAISPKTKADEDKMSFALQRVLEEDKSLRFVRNNETHEQVLYAMGDQAVDVVVIIGRHVPIGQHARHEGDAAIILLGTDEDDVAVLELEVVDGVSHGVLGFRLLRRDGAIP